MAQLFEHAQSNCFLFLASQTCQTWLWACAEWREVCELRTSAVGTFPEVTFLGADQKEHGL